MDLNITTTNKKVFRTTQSIEMARLVFLRFGEDLPSATKAWNRLLENNCSEEQFAELVFSLTHTENCQGWCVKSD